MNLTITQTTGTGTLTVKKDMTRLTVWNYDPGSRYVNGNIAVCSGRLSLASDTPVTTTDQTAKSVLYFVPYAGNYVSLYDGISAWATTAFTQVSLNLAGLTANTNYDIYLYDNSGTLTLEPCAWTNDTTRATDLAIQDGVYVKTGALTRRYLGTIRTTATAGECEDSTVKRYVWNYYNRVNRFVRTSNSNASWAYTGAVAAREYNNAGGQTRGQFILGVIDESLLLISTSRVGMSATSSCVAGVGIDTVTNYQAFIYGAGVGLWNSILQLELITPNLLAAGYHYISQTEYVASTSGTVTYYGSTSYCGKALIRG